MDWWTFARKSLALKSTNDVGRCPVPAPSRKDGLNPVGKRHPHVVLTKVKYSMSFKSFMDLRNSKISMGGELFPTDVLDKAIEKSSKVLHDEAIRKAVTHDKPSAHGKKLHFSTMPRKQQGPQPKKPTGSSSGSSLHPSTSKSSSSKVSCSSSRQGKEKKF